MGMIDTERQQHFLQLAATHAEDFKTRVAQHDRENTFPFENVKAMKESGYTNMTVPEELGGGGVNVLDFTLAQERLAYGDGPTAVVVLRAPICSSTSFWLVIAWATVTAVRSADTVVVDARSTPFTSSTLFFLTRSSAR